MAREVDMSGPRCQTLCLAYPCSVYSGVDPVAYAKELHSRAMRPNSDPAFKDQLCRVFGPEESDLTDLEKVKKSAEELNKRFDYNVESDRTSMKKDWKLVDQLWANSVNHPSSRVISEAGDEHIMTISSFLHQQQYQVKVLYLISHGLSNGMADQLHANPADDKLKKSKCWRWALNDCEASFRKTPGRVTSEAKMGDLVVFSSGFLTPEWVVEQLREHDQCGTGSTIVLVIDSCYSGTWRERISSLVGCLTCTRVLLQTAAAHDEEAYGYFFTPLFLELQKATEEEIEEVKRIPRNDISEVPQMPTFYDSKNDSKKDSSADDFVQVEIQDLKFRFFNHPVFFCKFAYHFASKAFGAVARGIPEADLQRFFQSFGTPFLRIQCFKLKVHKGHHTPMAFFLTEWHGNVYYLHLHFDNFQQLRLTGISHAEVRQKEFGIYAYEEVLSTLKRINCNMRDWPLKTDQILSACEDFVRNHKINWKDENSWTMTDTIPPKMIRSRNAVFEEVLWDKHSLESKN